MEVGDSINVYKNGDSFFRKGLISGFLYIKPKKIPEKFAFVLNFKKWSKIYSFQDVKIKQSKIKTNEKSN